MGRVPEATNACSWTIEFCVPVRPIFIMLARRFLVLTVRGRGTAKRAREVHRGRKCRAMRVDPAGELGDHFLECAAISIGVAEHAKEP